MKKPLATMLLLLLVGIVFLSGCSDNTAQEPENPNPIVTIEMEDGGIIKAELYPSMAPNTVHNFIALVEDGFYDGLTFHRVLTDFVIQGGDPEGTGRGGPGYSIKGEFASNDFSNDLSHDRGVLSMARSALPDSAGSQFFIMVADNPNLDGNYATFGKVTEGMDTVDKIVNVETTGETDLNGYPLGKPVEPPVMKKVTVDTFEVEYPEPEKIE